MNKMELIDQLSAKANLSRQQSEDALNGLIEIITTTIKSGSEVNITGFGAFSSRKREARQGVNPQNPSEKIQIPTVVVPKFKAGKTLKDALKS